MYLFTDVGLFPLTGSARQMYILTATSTVVYASNDLEAVCLKAHVQTFQKSGLRFDRHETSG